jgi:hypothetical protein
MDELAKQIAQENPDLPEAMLADLLAAQAESRAGLGEPYRWGVVGDLGEPETELLG